MAETSTSSPAAVPSPVASPSPAPRSRWIGFIERRPKAAFGGFLALHFAIWTALPALLYANLPLDLIEAVAGCNDYGYVGVGADFPEQVEPVFLPEPQVEEYQARLAQLQLAAEVLAACCRACGKIVLFEVACDHAACRRIVINNEYMGGPGAVIGALCGFHCDEP